MRDLFIYTVIFLGVVSEARVATPWSNNIYDVIDAQRPNFRERSLIPCRAQGDLSKTVDTLRFVGACRASSPACDFIVAQSSQFSRG